MALFVEDDSITLRICCSIEQAVVGKLANVRWHTMSTSWQVIHSLPVVGRVRSLFPISVRGFAKKKIPVYYGSGWVGGSRGQDYKRFSSMSRCQLTICAQKWRSFVLFSTVSLKFVLSRVCVFLYSLGPRSHSEFFLGKSSQNSCSKPVLIFWSSIPCVFCLYMSICQKKYHFGFSKSLKFQRVILLVLMTFCDVQ